MAQKILIMGESGTGKSTSIRNCDPDITAVVNPVGKPLPFKGSNKFATLNNETDSDAIVSWIQKQVKAGKKIIIVDDFQYMLAIPYMNRIKETGWDKYNDFGANYFSMIDVCTDLPDDVVMVFMTHLETLDNGLTTVKLIGKLLREKITIEGLFTIVLRSGCSEGKYYFYTQNSGKDTVKSPMGMFGSYAIDNDLNYVVDKIKNYYEIGDYKSDAEMEKEDEAVASDLEKPDSNGRRSRKSREEKSSRKSREEVQKENKEKLTEYMEKQSEAIQSVTDEEEVPLEEVVKATENVPVPDLQKPPRRTRKDRTEEPADTPLCQEDTYFYIAADDNYIMKHAGDEVPEGGTPITKEEFAEGVKRLSKAPETQPTARRRRTRN